MTTFDLALLVLRLVVGLTFAAHGAQKAFGWWQGPGPANWVKAIHRMGFHPPTFFAAASIFNELAGGLALALGFAIVGPLTLTNVLWFSAIERVGPSRAALFVNLQPFVAALFAYFVLSEHVSGLQLAGGVLILAGILLERARRRGVGLGGDDRETQIPVRAVARDARGVRSEPRLCARLDGRGRCGGCGGRQERAHPID